MDISRYWLWLSSRDGIGPAKALSLLKIYKTPENLYNASSSEIRQSGLSERLCNSLMDKDLSHVDRIVSRCNELNIKVLTPDSAAYPERLRNIYDPPLALYVRGSLPEIDISPLIGIVGTRDCTPYGRKTAEKISFELCREGCLVVSGMAKGIDAAAARGALMAGGTVVGVIGSGVDIVYPSENRELFELVAERGAIVSEYEPGSRPLSHHFPARNRIISGLSLGVVVIEAPEKSGALITAARALEQGRDVFAVPADIDSESSFGSNRLLRAGAVPALSAADIVDEYRFLYGEELKNNRGRLLENREKTESGSVYSEQSEENISKNSIDNRLMPVYDKPSVEMSEEESLIYELLGQNTLQLDELIILSGIPGGKLLAALTMMEIKGLIVQEPGKRFRQNR